MDMTPSAQRKMELGPEFKKVNYLPCLLCHV